MYIPTVVRAEAITGMKQQLCLFILVLNNKCNNYIREGPLEWPLQRILSTLSKGRQGCAVRKIQGSLVLFSLPGTKVSCLGPLGTARAHP